jgi:hypothetical protein
MVSTTTRFGGPGVTSGLGRRPPSPGPECLRKP